MSSLWRRTVSGAEFVIVDVINSMGFRITWERNLTEGIFGLGQLVKKFLGIILVTLTEVGRLAYC